MLPTVRREQCTQTDGLEDAKVDIDAHLAALRELEEQRVVLQETLARVEEYRERLLTTDKRIAELEVIEQQVTSSKSITYMDSCVETDALSEENTKDLSPIIRCHSSSQTEAAITHNCSMQTDRGVIVAAAVDALTQAGDEEVETAVQIGCAQDPDQDSPTPLLRDKRCDVAKVQPQDRSAASGAAYNWDPLEGGLTSYVVMVGVGVAAIVIRVLLRRLASKRL